jgi:Ni/Co efflux regulator RcnB
MSLNVPFRRTALLVFLGAALAMTSAFAEKPSWAGGEKAGKHERSNDRHNDRRHEARDDRSHSSDGVTVNVNAYFGDRERHVVRDYYADEYRGGRCPPGLAKKHNGCMPPGQAKKWSVGHRLPRDVVFYDLSPEIVVRLGTPPARHRYVRVASDILLIAVGTGMVVDAIEDLGRM